MTDSLDRLRAALEDRYAVEEEIGRGGMASVYLAEDLRHHRQVAIKVLRPDLAATLGPERFLREIDVAANLQHPHILPLLDSGEADGLLFYVMPYVEGRSLRDRLSREVELPIPDAVRILRDVVDALTEAHAHGVVHRDIKPENILLRGRHALVTDFGVAKAVIDATGRQKLTTAGVALGTPAYMAPEQATADPHLDHRTDIYAVGAVAYELLTGRPVFTGTTPQMVLAAHVSEAPQAVRLYRDAVPPALESLVMRCLEKKPADRFQGTDELLSQLEILAATTGLVTPADTRPVQTVQGRRRWLGPGLLAATAVLVIVLALLGLLTPGPLNVTTSNNTQVTRDPGSEFQPAISPDGREVAYVLVTPGPFGRIVVRSTIEIGGGGESRPAAELSGSHIYPTWTPDGALLRFWSCPTGDSCGWRETGKLGGSVRLVQVPRTTTRLAWSRDGTRIAFGIRDSIFAGPVDGEPGLLGVHTVSPWDPHSLDWSPDGRFIAYVNGNPQWRYGANVSNSSIWIIDAAGGDPVPVTDETSLNVSPKWLPDSRHLLFVSDRDGARGIYVVEAGPEGARGPPRSVPGPADPHSVSVSADGGRLAYSKFTVAQNIWSLAIPDSGSVSIGEAVPVTRGIRVIEQHDLSPDGQWFVFDSAVRGEFDIYRMRSDGDQPELIADIDGDAFEPAFSPDGTEIAFYGGGPRSRTEVWVTSVNGGVPEQITRFPGFDQSPSWSPDGLSIAFGSEGPDPGNGLDIWIVTRDSVGGAWSEPARLTDFGCGPRAEWAPDGRSLLCSAERDFVRISTAGEELDRQPLPASLFAITEPRYSIDSSLLVFQARSNEGGRGLWTVPAAGGEFREVVRFDDPDLFVPLIPALTVGPDRLYVTVAQYDSDIWVVDLEW